jgi:hypothetical protein
VPDWQPVGQVRRRKAVVLDGSGNGSVFFDVPSANHKWTITDVVSATDQAQTVAPYPTVTIYLGGQQVGVSEGASWTGNQDIFRGRIDMEPGLDLTVAYAGGVPGSTATVVIEGDSYLWR